MMKVGKSDWEGTFAGTASNDGSAPRAAVREAAIERRRSTRMYGCSATWRLQRERERSQGLSGHRYSPLALRTSASNMCQGTPSCSCSQSNNNPPLS